MSIREPWDVLSAEKSSHRARPQSRDQSPSPPFPGRQAGDVQVDGCDGVDPLIQALIDRLPKSNELWSLDDRAKWLRTLISVFDLVYKTSEQEQTPSPSCSRTGEPAAQPVIGRWPPNSSATAKDASSLTCDHVFALGIKLPLHSEARGDASVPPCEGSRSDP